MAKKRKSSATKKRNRKSMNNRVKSTRTLENIDKHLEELESMSIEERKQRAQEAFDRRNIYVQREEQLESRAHKMIMGLREKMNIPEEEMDPKVQARLDREREARKIRMEYALTDEDYVEMWNRDPYTDEWLGDGPVVADPILAALEDRDGLSEEEKQEELEYRTQVAWDTFVETSVVETRGFEKEELFSENLSHKKKKELRLEDITLNGEELDWDMPDDTSDIIPDLPEMDIPFTREERKEMKKKIKRQKKKEKYRNGKKKPHLDLPQEMYDLAYWYLCEVMIPSEAEELYWSKYTDLNELVRAVQEPAEEWLRFSRTRPMTKKEAKKWKKQFEREQEEAMFDSKIHYADSIEPAFVVDDKFEFYYLDDQMEMEGKAGYDVPDDGHIEIPDPIWDKFLDWCDEHPLKDYKKKAKKKGMTAANYRRKVFLKQHNRKTAKYRKRLATNDTPDPFLKAMQESLLTSKEYKKLKKQKLKELDRLTRDDEDDKYFERIVKIGGGATMDPDRLKEGTKRYYDNRIKMSKTNEKYRRKAMENSYGPKFKERAEWFKSYGGDIDDLNYLMIDGKKVRVR